MTGVEYVRGGSTDRAKDIKDTLMANSFSLGNVELVSSTDAVEKSASMEPEGPFPIHVLGDFSGRATRDAAAAAGVEPRWRPIGIDRDNFDQVMSRLGVELRL